MENNTIKTFDLIAREVSDGSKNFTVYSSKINGKYYRIKFKRSCSNAPVNRGKYKITVDLGLCSIEKGKKFTTNTGYEGTENDCIWIDSFISCVPFTDEELRASNVERMSDIFGTKEGE